MRLYEIGIMLSLISIFNHTYVKYFGIADLDYFRVALAGGLIILFIGFLLPSIKRSKKHLKKDEGDK